MDVWWGICVLFMSMAILEYAYLLRKRMSLGPLPVKWTYQRPGKDKEFIQTKEPKKDITSEEEYKQWANRVDGVSLVASVSGFCFVTVVYGAICLSRRQSIEENSEK